MNRLVVFGDSFTEGEGSNLELTHAIRDHYDNLKLGTKGAQICQQVNNDTGWPKVIAKLAKCPVENFGVSGYSNNKIMNSLRAISDENINSMSKSEARKRGHYLTVQVGAFRYKMNEETLDFINANYGDDFHIVKDKRLEYDLYMLGRYKSLSDVKKMNSIIKEGYNKK